ncbi:MAG TPA: hypothetical protein VG322_12480 [Candidatus Acidoferrales bacterium]|jgi:hypothetical protein|nr:hypothetical protein [Candidatus Acidoferrales bacterium]
MKMFVAAVIALMASAGIFAQAKRTAARAPAADRDQLGMTCAQILAMSSSDWIAQFKPKVSEPVPDQDKTVRAIAVYGKCYDARTDRLKAALSRRGSGPLMGAGGDFRDFEQALQSFTAKALASNDPPATPVKSAYAALYEEQFRYGFYERFEARPAKAEAAKDRASKPNPAKTPVPAPSGAKTQEPAKSDAAATDKSMQAATPPDPMTASKNRFGELLDALPDDRMHPLHSAFGDIVGRGGMSEETRLAVYRYAIFLLEPASDQPFSPPPF